MKLGTQILTEDGYEATVTFNGLCGVGIIYGLYEFTEEEIDAFRVTTADLFNQEPNPILDDYEPVALIRDKKDGTIEGMKCIGGKYKILKEGIDL